jgi:hypothetical protein
MPRPVLLFSFVLLFATGLGLVGLAQTTRPVLVREAPVDSADAESTARDFYAAINEMLASGDSVALDNLVIPDLVEHPRRPGEGGREGLIRAVLARRAVFPGLRLVVEDAHPTGGGLVAVRLHAAGATKGSFLGLPVPVGTTVWGPIELLRVADGRVAERWGGAGEPTLLHPLWQSTLSATLTDVPPMVAVRRISWEAGATLTVVQNPAAWFLLVERGTLTVSAGPEPRVTTGIDREATPASGDLVVIPPGTGFSAANAGTAGVSALAVVMWMPIEVSDVMPGSGGALNEEQAIRLGLHWHAIGEVTIAPGVVAQVLTTGSTVPVPSGATLSLGRIVLAPGAALSLPSEGALHVVVESGALDLDVEGSAAWRTRADGSVHELSDRSTVAADEGVVTTASPVRFWQTGTEPVEILVLTVVPGPS